MKMVEVKTADLIGKALDYAVAVAEGHPLCEECMHGTDALIIGTGRGDLKGFSPSTDWNQGGPLIEKYLCQVKIQPPYWQACARKEFGITWIYGDGDTALIAACRAIVAAKLGDTISVPEEALE